MENFKGSKYNWSVNTEINQNEFGSYYLTIDAYGDNEISIASVFGDEYNDKKMNANALLISKAPEMLEMLIEISKTAEKIWEIEQDSPFFDEIDFAKLDDLIKEATEI